MEPVLGEEGGGALRSRLLGACDLRILVVEHGIMVNNLN